MSYICTSDQKLLNIYLSFSITTLDMLSKVKAITKFLRFKRSSRTKTTVTSEQNDLNVAPIKQLTISNQQRTEKNQEDITIIWLSKNVKNIKEQGLVKSLRSINDYVQVRLQNLLLSF